MAAIDLCQRVNQTWTYVYVSMLESSCQVATACSYWENNFCKKTKKSSWHDTHLWQIAQNRRNEKCARQTSIFVRCAYHLRNSVLQCMFTSIIKQLSRHCHTVNGTCNFGTVSDQVANGVILTYGGQWHNYDFLWQNTECIWLQQHTMWTIYSEILCILVVAMSVRSCHYVINNFHMPVTNAQLVFNLFL